MSEIINKKLIIVAGPCSISEKNVEDVFRIAKISVSNSGKRKRAVFGTRVVGLKSRTFFSSKTEGMGIDLKVFLENFKAFIKGRPINALKVLPSVKIAQDIVEKTGMMVATEIVSPLLQLPFFEGRIGKGKLLIWNPSVNQLGWQSLKMGFYAKRNGWILGLKNGKWLSAGNSGRTTAEESWLGLADYAKFRKSGFRNDLIFIHRGFDLRGKGKYRSLPMHEIARKVKLASGAKMFFDPSHSFGPKLRSIIAKETIRAMKIMVDVKHYLYDGILIEVGNSSTDKNQHIGIREFEELCNNLAGFRDLVGPKN